LRKGNRGRLRQNEEITVNCKVPEAAAAARLVPLLTVEDLERILRVDRRTIARLCNKGQLPRPLKLGGSNRWRMRDFEHIL
jgi:predicted DNA-binding transcriptional regulator AlpA